jgi:hypothetical protein
MGCIWSSHADISLPTAPPPQPEPVQARVYVGESVDIPLTGVTRSSASLQFLIRRQPTAGRLSEIRMTGQNTAVVTYTHNPHAGVGLDQFRYAVGAPGIGVSTPAIVTVNAIERPSSFVAPARLDFPDVAVGHSVAKTLELRNEGGGRITGQLTLPAPWKVTEGDGTYSLGPGESQTLEIVFTPKEARQYADTAEFSHEAGLELGLGGNAYSPIEIAPRVVRVEADGHNEARAGSFIIRNVSDDDRDLQITGPKEIVVQDSIHVAAKSEAQVALHTRPGFLGTLDAELAITGNGETVEVPLQVAAAPARLAVSPEAVDFGTLAVGRSDTEKITLRNTGGSEAKLRVKMPDGISIDPNPTYEAIAPGASKVYELSYARPIPGHLSDTIVIEAGEIGVRLPVRAVIKDDGSSHADTSASEQKSQEVTYSDVPPVEKLGVTRQTKTELDLAWKKAPGAQKYILFARSMTFDEKGVAKFHFHALDEVKVRLIRDEARATLAGLKPGQQVTLIIVGVDAEGNNSKPSFPFVVATKPSPPVEFPWGWLAFFCLIAFAAIIVRERRRVRAASDAEIERMAQL